MAPWDSDAVNLDVLSINHQVIHASVQVSSSPSPWLFSAVYASPLHASRLRLWDHLKSFANSHSLPWMIAGDFNEILSHHEKFSNTPANRNEISSFRNCLDSCDLLDLGFHGPRFTWTNKRPSGLVMERLDRVLCNPSWRRIFDEATVLHLPRTSSDHNPLLINTSAPTLRASARPFRLETMWFNDLSFPEIVKNSWRCFPENVSFAIKDFTSKVTLWNRQCFGNLFHRKKRLIARLNGLQKAIALHPTETLLRLDSELSLQYQNLLSQEEDFWAL